MKELLALHEFESDNGLDGPEHQYAKSRPWQLKIVSEVIEGEDNKDIRLFPYLQSTGL